MVVLGYPASQGIILQHYIPRQCDYAQLVVECKIKALDIEKVAASRMSDKK